MSATTTADDAAPCAENLNVNKASLSDAGFFGFNCPLLAWPTTPASGVVLHADGAVHVFVPALKTKPLDTSQMHKLNPAPDIASPLVFHIRVSPTVSSMF